jgi:hypothetical protein
VQQCLEILPAASALFTLAAAVVNLTTAAINRRANVGEPPPRNKADQPDK